MKFLPWILGSLALLGIAGVITFAILWSKEKANGEEQIKIQDLLNLKCPKEIRDEYERMKVKVKSNPYATEEDKKELNRLRQLCEN